MSSTQLETAPEGLDTEAVAPEDERRRTIDEYAADARFVRDFLARYHTPTQPFAMFVSEKFHLSIEEFERLEGGTALLHLYRLCDDLADRLASLEREHVRLVALVRDLEPWLGVRLQIARWRESANVVLIAGTVPSGDAPRIRAALREVSPYVSVAQYGAGGPREAWMVLSHRSCVDEVRSALAATQFTDVAFAGLEDYPAEESSHARDRIGAIYAELAGLRAKASDIARDRFAEAVAIVEAIDSDAASAAARASFGRTERAFVVRGWVRAGHEDELNAALATWSDALDVSFSEPRADDSPPVELDNPPWLRPFEVLTDLYGRPSYRELDPTPLLAPFFLLFFAICISDVGYGAMLAGGAYLIKKRLDVAAGVKRFMDLMMIGGVASMVVGVAFRSYFAMDVTWLPSFLRYKPLLDPLNEIQTFLIFTIALGLVQVFFGVGVSAYDSFRRGDPGTAISEQISTIFLFAMVGVAVVVWSANPGIGRAALVSGLLGTMLMQGRTLEAALNGKELPFWDRAFGWVWLTAMLAWVVSLASGGPSTALWVLLGLSLTGLFVSRAVRRCVLSFLGGAYAVYGMTSFLGDVLSYTRLAALGLSGALVGMVFNILAGLVWTPVAGLWNGGGLGWLGAAVVAVLAVAVFVFGHVFNVVINLLGAFVHPARLQFVEFFSKFYEGGGRAFAPFRFVTQSVVLHAGAVRREGEAGS
jgi:V/A-type H+-transporting ATPase subunit I